MSIDFTTVEVGSETRRHRCGRVGGESADFRAEIEPALRKACYKCHGPETAEGEIRVDMLDPDLLHGDGVSWWLEVSSAVSNGEMPPEDGPELTDEDRRKSSSGCPLKSRRLRACSVLNMDIRRFAG